MIVYINLPPEEQVGERKHVYSHIECDVEGCGKKSPPTDVLMKKHGLQGCGWYALGGHHRCPKHFDTECPAIGAVYRDQ